ncbi:MAG: hypothetical protein LBD13_07330 [Spirochaetaceae bacterium]|jgi:hypothetical protein|nr:hypothetical protein [Spirochaetaceae bacterium]
MDTVGYEYKLSTKHPEELGDIWRSNGNEDVSITVTIEYERGGYNDGRKSVELTFSSLVDGQAKIAKIIEFLKAERFTP